MVVGAFRERPREGNFINVLLNLSGVFSSRSSVLSPNFAKHDTDGDFIMLLDIFRELVHLQKHENSI